MKKYFLLFFVLLSLLNKGICQPLSSYTFSAFSRTYVPLSGGFIGSSGGGGLG
jgi:hypothetical protein